MKKLTTLLAIAFVLFCQVAQAQSLDDKAAQIADTYCTDVNETFYFVDEDVRTYILKSAAATDEKAQNILEEAAGKELLQKVAEQRAKMDSKEVVETFKKNVNTMGVSLYKITDEELKKNDSTQKDFILLIQKKLSNEGCAFAGFTFENIVKEIFTDGKGK
jgi:hypothetical protein